MHLFSSRKATGFGWVRAVAVTALSSVIGLVAVAAPSAAASDHLGHGAVAYGTSIQLGSVFSSGPTALATLGCTNRSGILHSNSAVSAGLLTAGSVGAILDEVSTSKSSTTSKSTIHAVSLFSGLITADSVAATGTTSTDGSGFSTSGDTTTANLVINGTPITLAAPNTIIPLAGLGSVTVNEQISKVKADEASIIVNALHVHVAVTNAFGFPVGTDLLIGHTRASLVQNPTKLVGGQAYATSVEGTGLSAGKTAVVRLPCEGTDGAVRINTSAGTVIPDVLSTGTEKSTASGTATRSFASGVTTDTVQNVLLLNLVSADEVKAEANGTKFSGDAEYTDAGSAFTGIAVVGIPLLPDPVPPNYVHKIPGVGTLYLHRVIQKKTHIEIRMIELVLSVPVGPLAAGTDIKIGVAEVAMH